MNRNLKILLSALMAALLVPAAVAGAQSLSQEQILAGLSSKYRDINGLQATYSRVAAAPTTDQIFKSNSSQVASGVLYWKRPDKLLMEQSSPAQETMVTDGSTVWWHIPAERLVYRYRNMDVAGQLRPLMSFLGGLNRLNSDFKVSSAPFDKSRPGQYGLELVPKSGPEGGVERLTVWCDGNFTLTGFRLSSITGETTDFYLTGFRENPSLAASLFNFKVPRGTEVVEEDGY